MAREVTEYRRVLRKHRQALLAPSLATLDPKQIDELIIARCVQAGISPIEKPFEVIETDTGPQLYATANFAAALAARHKLSTQIMTTYLDGDYYMAKARVSDPSGRFTESEASVYIGKAHGQFLANCRMKAQTKATRRAIRQHTGFLDLVEDVDDLRFEAGPLIDHEQVSDEIENAPTTALTAPPPVDWWAMMPEGMEDELLASKFGRWTKWFVDALQQTAPADRSAICDAFEPQLNALRQMDRENAKNFIAKVESLTKEKEHA